MSIQLTTLVLDLEKRLEVLERTVAASHRRYGALAMQARARTLQGDALRDEIRAILEAHKSPRPLKAYTVWTLITREPRPKLRRVQQVIRLLKTQDHAPPDTRPPTIHELGGPQRAGASSF